jgi:hypothetical protein
LAVSAGTPARVNVGVGSWIERRARVFPDDVALIAPERSISYAELARRIRGLASGLRRLGVGRGDRVAWLGANDPAFLEAVFASGLLGATLAPGEPSTGGGGDPVDPRGHGAGRPDPPWRDEGDLAHRSACRTQRGGGHPPIASYSVVADARLDPTRDILGIGGV